MLRPEETAWVDFYQVVAPYSQDGALDHVLISKICEAEGIDFLTAFEWLTFIHSVLMEHQTDENKRVQGSQQTDESESL